MAALGASRRVTIEIEKRLPVQGGLGAASSNAVATMLALEHALRKRLTGSERLRIAAEVGSDLPLFAIGGTVLGVGRGEEVYPLPDLPGIPLVVITPEVGVSTPQAFADWDELTRRETQGRSTPLRMATTDRAGLTHPGGSDRLNEVGRVLSAWLSSTPVAGAPAGGKRGGRAGNLSDLVRAGIRNDFERVVFSQIPELLDMKRALERAGSRYASLSGSGSALYGLFGSPSEAAKAAKHLQKQGLRVVATRTLTRREYWKKLLAGSH
jgi:4-diphosphocytidyl-2-C-methyl-D-erythritol kinase